MLFSHDEIVILQSAVETYNEEPRYNLKPEIQEQLCQSILNKLKYLTSLTYFTKKEYSAMLLALAHIESCREILNIPVDNAFDELVEKVIELSKPETE